MPTHPLARAAVGVTLAAMVSATLGRQPSPTPPAPVTPGTNPTSGSIPSPAWLSLPSATSLRSWHDRIASEPHVAGTPGDRRVIDTLAASFRDMGLDVQVHEFWAYLPRPVSAELELVAPEQRTFILKETPLTEDPYSQRDGLSFGWNAFSGSGEVTADVVYANYATKHDFEQLRELGVDCTGKVVIARYGGNFRGYKAKFAEAAGAAGLIIYTDPADGGYMKGLMYPEGGYANDTCIERGCLVTLDYQGDALTPGIEATKDAARLDPSSVALPKIPVQPVGWSVAVEIMKRMKGAPVPTGWQGGLPLAYRLTGGDADVRVRLMVKQERAITPTCNVVATLRGTEQPDLKVILGCHHDAWGYGAADPTCGTITLLESARVFADLASRGVKPRRSIVFAAWGAEEFGIVGSTEWVESRRDDLVRNAVAYINLDMASMGVDFGSSASPSLQRVIDEAARAVPQARASDGKSVLDAWAARSPDPSRPGHPVFGDLGGGSDHVGFLCHAGVPSASFGAGGAKGTSYHSIYDSLAWYRKVVGDDYEPALMVTRAASSVANLLANEPVAPLDPAAYGRETIRQLKALNARAIELGLNPADAPANAEFLPVFTPLVKAAAEFDAAAAPLASRLDHRAAIESGPDTLSAAARLLLNAKLLEADRAWLVDSGLPGRAWYKNLYAAPDRDSGYAAWMLPLLRAGVESKDPAAIDAAVHEYIRVFERLTAIFAEIDELIGR